jgi:hypothetical protein
VMGGGFVPEGGTEGRCCWVGHGRIVPGLSGA